MGSTSDCPALIVRMPFLAGRVPPQGTAKLLWVDLRVLRHLFGCYQLCSHILTWLDVLKLFQILANRHLDCAAVIGRAQNRDRYELALCSVVTGPAHLFGLLVEEYERQGAGPHIHVGKPRAGATTDCENQIEVRKQLCQSHATLAEAPFWSNNPTIHRCSKRHSQAQPSIAGVTRSVLAN